MTATTYAETDCTVVHEGRGFGEGMIFRGKRIASQRRKPSGRVR